MAKDATELNGLCHCGKVRFRARLLGGLDSAVRCNCSLCRMRGAVIVFVSAGDFELVTGKNALSVYQFHSNTARHYFCATCGIYTHHQRRFDPSEYAVNVACLDGVSPFDFDQVPVLNGARHPRDHGGGALEVIGCLRFDSRG